MFSHLSIAFFCKNWKNLKAIHRLRQIEIQLYDKNIHNFKIFKSEKISQIITRITKNLAWFIIDFFSYNIDLIAQARKNFRPQETDDVTVERSDCV